jgi:hypothetical protein
MLDVLSSICRELGHFDQVHLRTFIGILLLLDIKLRYVTALSNFDDPNSILFNF